MLPNQLLKVKGVKTIINPSLTYKLDFETKRIVSKIDGDEAILQAIKKTLSTERYAYVIYNSQYGVELERLVGKDYDYICSDIERTIKDALLVDNRIRNITDFTWEKTGLNEMNISFVVHTQDNSLNIEMEVNIS